MNQEKRDYFFAALELELTRGASPAKAIEEATRQTAYVFQIGPSRCDHGIIEGEWCSACNREQKWARLENMADGETSKS